MFLLNRMKASRKATAGPSLEGDSAPLICPSSVCAYRLPRCTRLARGKEGVGGHGCQD